MSRTLYTLLVQPQHFGNLTLRLWRDVVRMELLTTKYNPNDFQKVPPLPSLVYVQISLDYAPKTVLDEWPSRKWTSLPIGDLDRLERSACRFGAC